MQDKSESRAGHDAVVINEFMEISAFNSSPDNMSLLKDK